MFDFYGLNFVLTYLLIIYIITQESTYYSILNQNIHVSLLTAIKYSFASAFWPQALYIKEKYCFFLINKLKDNDSA